MQFKMIHENYNVCDLAASLAFYEKALGLHEKRRKEAADGSYIIVYVGNDASDFELELTWLRDHPQAYDIGEEEFHLAFRADDFAAAHALHSEMGCICFENAAPWASTSFRTRTATGWRSYRHAEKGCPNRLTLFGPSYLTERRENLWGKTIDGSTSTEKNALCPRTLALTVG